MLVSLRKKCFYLISIQGKSRRPTITQFIFTKSRREGFIRIVVGRERRRAQVRVLGVDQQARGSGEAQRPPAQEAPECHQTSSACNREVRVGLVVAKVQAICRRILPLSSPL